MFRNSIRNEGTQVFIVRITSFELGVTLTGYFFGYLYMKFLTKGKIGLQVDPGGIMCKFKQVLVMGCW